MWSSVHFFAADVVGKTDYKEATECNVLGHQSMPQKTWIPSLLLQPWPLWASVFLPQHIYLACIFLGQVMALFFHATFGTAEPWPFGNAAIKILESSLILPNLTITQAKSYIQKSWNPAKSGTSDLISNTRRKTRLAVWKQVFNTLSFNNYYQKLD